MHPFCLPHGYPAAGAPLGPAVARPAPPAGAFSHAAAVDAWMLLLHVLVVKGGFFLLQASLGVGRGTLVASGSSQASRERCEGRCVRGDGSASLPLPALRWDACGSLALRSQPRCRARLMLRFASTCVLLLQGQGETSVVTQAAEAACRSFSQLTHRFMQSPPPPPPPLLQDQVEAMVQWATTEAVCAYDSEQVRALRCAVRAACRARAVLHCAYASARMSLRA